MYELVRRRLLVAGLVSLALVVVAPFGVGEARAAAESTLTAAGPPVALPGAYNVETAGTAPDGALELVSSQPGRSFFTSFSTLLLHHFAADGTTTDGQPAASQVSDKDQVGPAIAALAGGGFVVAWTARVPRLIPFSAGRSAPVPGAKAFGDTGTLTARLLDAAGQPLRGDLTLGADDDAATDIRLAGLGSGGFVASWTQVAGPAGAGVVFRRFDGAGQPLSGTISLTSGSTSRNIGLAALADGGFVAAWGQSGQGLFLQRFDADGAAVGAAVQAVGSDLGGPALLAASPSGRVALAWMTTNPDLQRITAIKAGAFDADLNPVAPPVTVAATVATAWPVLAALAMDPRGRIVVAWNQHISPGVSTAFAQLYEAAGGPLGAATRIEGDSGQETAEQVFAGSDGGWSILWSGAVSGAAGQFVQRYRTANCSPLASSLCLEGDRFRLDVRFRDPLSQRFADGHPVPLTADTGALWFFDPANPELIVKMLDGTSVNGHHWLFYGSLTDVEFDLTVTDTATGQQHLYHNAGGTLASLADVQAFPPPHAAAAGPSAGAVSADRLPDGDPALPALAASAARLERPPAAAAPRGAAQAAPLASCHSQHASLCLEHSRFSAAVSWRDPRTGQTAASEAVQLSAEGGYFWFFGPDDVELSVKVLDGTAVNGHVWVFYASLTDVEFDLTVFDNLSPAGARRTYHNPAHHLASAADTSAF
jgi:hypothetical protein